MPEIESFNLRFVGNKVELKKQLEELCAKTGKSQNATIIECVEQLMATREEIKPQ
jgi:predicted DNA-binding protein